jgi:hypothetical protein
MGDIMSWTPDIIRQIIRRSNEDSAKGSQQYIKWENRAIQNDYEFIECPCGENCWSKRHKCEGHYRIKEIEFNQFLETFATLWIRPRARRNIKEAVIRGIVYNARERNAINPLQKLRDSWPEILSFARSYNLCRLCNPSVPLLHPVTNLYEGKIWSQLFYDSLGPFDTKSRSRIIKAGYSDPSGNFLAMNRELFNDIRQLSDLYGLTVGDIRQLDSPWMVNPELPEPTNGQPLSRVIDKMFYSPDPQRA